MPAKPTALKILSGNPGKRPLNENEPKPELVVPDMPSHLDKEARKEWRRIVPELHSLGLLSNIDVAGLAAYCTAYGRHVEAERMIKKHGATMITPNGYEQKSSWLAISDKAMEQMLKFLIQFGLTPASRSKVSATSKTDDDEGRFFS